MREMRAVPENQRRESSRISSSLHPCPPLIPPSLPPSHPSAFDHALARTHVLSESRLVLVDRLRLELFARMVDIVLNLVEVLGADTCTCRALYVATSVVSPRTAEAAHRVVCSERWLGGDVEECHLVANLASWRGRQMGAVKMLLQ